MTEEQIKFVQKFRPRMLQHLEEDILPYWLLPSMLGDPVGNFPTYANQYGVPDDAKPRYARMHGRQTYAYLAAYYLLHREGLLDYGLAGLKKLKGYENEKGGYFAKFAADGHAFSDPVTIQDQCYSVFPHIMAYRVTHEREHLEKIWEFVAFIDKGPYLRGDGSYCDSLMPDLVTVCDFETPTLNIVSVIDFINLILVPALNVTPVDEITVERKGLLVKWVDLLVADYWANGIFWNDKVNRSDCHAKHVDLGHTSKSYGILLKANELFAKWGQPSRHSEVMQWYPEIVCAASDDKVGWKTDFDVSATTFQDSGLQWWRHILIDQTVFHYASKFPHMIPLLEKGVRAWFDCNYVDKVRTCRGIREGLRSDGSLYSDVDEITCKANCWKNAYHEVEHVLTLCGEEHE